MAEKVHHHVAKRMRQLLTYSRTTTEDYTSEKEEQPAPRWRKQMTSGMHQTGAITVVRKVNWPHKVVYTVEGKPTLYQNIAIPLFIHSYIIIKEGEEAAIKETVASRLKAFMSNAE